MLPSIEVVNGDVLTTACDILILKYAWAFRGADLAVARALGLVDSGFEVPPDGHRLVPTDGKLACKQVLFYGVANLVDFGYREIRSFATQSLKMVEATGVRWNTVATTMHGVGYGLDEREAFTAQIAGLLDYLTRASLGYAPGRIVFIERDPSRYWRMKAILQRILLETGLFPAATPTDAPAPPAATSARLPDAGISSEAKKHVFVALPYVEEMEDVYEFGINQTVHEAGFLCERCDRDVFTGNILDRIKARITTANLMIADLTGSNANVYLEVGYAWGKNVPTLLIAREGEELKFDVKAQKCIYYKTISHLRKQLAECMLKLRIEA